MGKTVKVDADVWDEVVKHYMTVKEPTDADRRVIAYIMDKLSRQMRREDFRESQARYARINAWTKGEG